MPGTACLQSGQGDHGPAGQVAEQESTQDDGQAGNQSRQVAHDAIEPAGKHVSAEDIGRHRQEKHHHNPEHDLADDQGVGGLNSLPDDVVDFRDAAKQGIEAKDELAGAQAQQVSYQPADQQHADGCQELGETVDRLLHEFGELIFIAVCQLKSLAVVLSAMIAIAGAIEG